MGSTLAALLPSPAEMAWLRSAAGKATLLLAASWLGASGREIQSIAATLRWRRASMEAG